MENCSICHEYIVGSYKLQCEHIFCKTCIFKWGKLKHNCAICRKKFTFEEIKDCLSYFNINVEFNTIFLDTLTIPEKEYLLKYNTASFFGSSDWKKLLNDIIIKDPEALAILRKTKFKRETLNGVNEIIKIYNFNF